MKMFSKKKNPATYDEKYLVEEINMAKAALSAAYANFDNATDPDSAGCPDPALWLVQGKHGDP